MAIQLAPAALQRIKGYLATDPAAIGLRFGVRRTGCSGWGYAVDMARDERDGDTEFVQDGVRILVDADSLEPLESPSENMRLLAAATLGQVRLIDNMPVTLEQQLRG